jgi:2-phosphosulfolactate phosphatase
MSHDAPYAFLQLTQRPAKPRKLGMTMVIDKSLGLNAAADLVASAAAHIDLIKLGWGTSCVTSLDVLKEKIALYRSHGIRVLPGGTLFEIAFDRGKVDEYLAETKALGFDAIEVSNGIHPHLDTDKKHELIRRANTAGFYTLSEVGKKLPEEDHLLSSGDRVREARADLAAGAHKVVMESRESGTVGIFTETGKIDSRMAYDIFQQIDPDDIIWEAPRKEQQVWLLQQLGPHVNFGNIATNDVISLETLRLGLRGDTMREHRRNSTVVYLELGIGGSLRAQRRGDIIVMVDAIRASTTILQAFASGVSRIKPVTGADELVGDVTAGERGGEKLPNADYGNSPTELAAVDLSGRELVLSSTNGTECIRTSKGENSRVFIGSITNATAIARKVSQVAEETGKNITLLAAGRNNLPAIEDRIGVTEILKRIESPTQRGILAPHYSEDFERDFLTSDSGVNLSKLGFTVDVVHCSRPDIYDITPEYDGNYITASDIAGKNTESELKGQSSQ